MKSSYQYINTNDLISKYGWKGKGYYDLGNGKRSKGLWVKLDNNGKAYDFAQLGNRVKNYDGNYILLNNDGTITKVYNAKTGESPSFISSKENLMMRKGLIKDKKSGVWRLDVSNNKSLEDLIDLNYGSLKMLLLSDLNALKEYGKTFNAVVKRPDGTLTLDDNNADTDYLVRAYGRAQYAGSAKHVIKNNSGDEATMKAANEKKNLSTTATKLVGVQDVYNKMNDDRKRSEAKHKLETQYRIHNMYATDLDVANHMKQYDDMPTLQLTEASNSLYKGLNKFSDTAGKAMFYGTMGAIAGEALASGGASLLWNYLAKPIITHPIENIVVPQLTSKAISSGIDLTNKYGLTNISDTNRDLISTYGGFTLGGLGTGFVKNTIGKGLLKSGFGNIVEGNGLVSKLVLHLLRTPFMSGLTYKAIGNNIANIVVPNLAPGIAQGTSYHFTGKSLGENVSDLTGGTVNSNIADMILDGAIGSGASLYTNAFWNNASKLSGGKKGFHNNKEYFLNYAAGEGKDYRKNHPIQNILKAAKNLVFLTPPKNAAYQMTTLQGTRTRTGTTNYAPAGNDKLTTGVNYVDSWFSGSDKDLNGQAKEVGSFLIGNHDTSTGNLWERMVKLLGKNDGRFDEGQVGKIFSAADHSAQEAVLLKASFLNPKTGTYDPIILTDGSINPDLSGALINSRSNVLLNSVDKGGGRYEGTMLDIDGHVEVPIKTEDGKYMNFFIDTAGPGTGAGKGNSITDQVSRIMSATSSHQQVPGYFTGLTGRLQLLGTRSSSGTQDVGKVQIPWTAAETVDRRVLTYENIGGEKLNPDGTRQWDPVMEQLYGDTQAWKDITEAKAKALDTAAQTKVKAEERFVNGNFTPTDKEITGLKNKIIKNRDAIHAKEIELQNKHSNSNSSRKEIYKLKKLIEELNNELLSDMEVYTSIETLNDDSTNKLQKLLAQRRVNSWGKEKFAKELKGDASTHRGLEIIEGEPYEVAYDNSIEKVLNEESKKSDTSKEDIKLDTAKEKSDVYWEDVLSKDFSDLYTKSGKIKLPGGFKKNNYIRQSYFDALPEDIQQYVISKGAIIYKQGGKLEIARRVINNSKIDIGNGPMSSYLKEQNLL